MAEEIKQEDNQIPKKEAVEIENPGDRLENILREMNAAHEKENASMETSLFKEAQTLFKEFTGQDLMEKAKRAAEEEVEAEGSKMIPGMSFSAAERTKRELDDFKFKQQSFAVQKAWLAISEAEKKSYLNDINNFIAAVEKKIEELKKGGLNLSKEIFYNMLASGYMFLNLKKSFWTGKMLVPVLIGEGAYRYAAVSLKEFEDSTTMMQNLFDLVAKQAVEDKLAKDLLYAKRRWKKRKLRKAREILKAASRTMKSEAIQEAERLEIRKRLEGQIREKIRKELEVEERQALEKLSNIGEVGVLERMKEFEALEKKTDRNIKKEIEKIQKGLEKDIEERTDEEKRVGELLKKQLKKGRMSKARIAFLNKVTSGVEDKKQEESENISKEQDISAPVEDIITPINNTTSNPATAEPDVLEEGAVHRDNPQT